MTLKHSPAPWTIANDSDGWDNIVDADGRKIAEADSCSDGKDPDARLIAAAPTMLRLLRVLEGIYSGREDRSDSALRWREAMEESGDLIRRLDGEA